MAHQKKKRLAAGEPPDGGHDRLGKAAYAEQLAGLELELNNMARWLQAAGRRIVVVVEGRDTAGKGGVISAIAGALSPRPPKSSTSSRSSS